MVKYKIEDFSFTDMMVLGSSLRDLGKDAGSMEEVGDRVVRHLYDCRCEEDQAFHLGSGRGAAKHVGGEPLQILVQLVEAMGREEAHQGTGEGVLQGASGDSAAQ